MQYTWVTTFSALSFLAMAGCSGDAKPSSATSGLEVQARLASLSAGDREALCDWAADQYGGYGTTKACGWGVTTQMPDTRARCVASFDYKEGCDATVDDYERMTRADTTCKADKASSEALGRLWACYFAARQ